MPLSPSNDFTSHLIIREIKLSILYLGPQMSEYHGAGFELATIENLKCFPAPEDLAV